MPEVIHKYPLTVNCGRATVMMPRRRRILHVQAQHNVPCIWAVIDSESPLSPVRFEFVSTFGTVTESAGPYVGTVLLDGGSLVDHVFGGE